MICVQFSLSYYQISSQNILVQVGSNKWKKFVGYLLVTYISTYLKAVFMRVKFLRENTMNTL